MYYNEGIKSFFRGIIPSSLFSLYGVITYMLGYKSAVSRDITFDNMIAPFFIGGLSNTIT